MFGALMMPSNVDIIMAKGIAKRLNVFIKPKTALSFVSRSPNTSHELSTTSSFKFSGTKETTYSSRSATNMTATAFRHLQTKKNEKKKRFESGNETRH